MSSNNLDLYYIGYQDNLRSKPVNDNLQDVETEFNALRAEFQAGVASTVTEVTNARDYQDSLQDNIHLRKVYNNRVVLNTHFKVTEIGTPGMHVQIATGAGIVDGRGVYLTAVQTSATIATAASGKHRLDAAVISSSNQAYIKAGAEVATSSAVEYPTINNNEMILAHFTITNTTTAIEDAEITDDRITAINPFRDFDYFNATFSYNGTTSNIKSFTVTERTGVENSFDLTYTGDLISSIGVTVDNIRYTSEYTYNATTEDITAMELVLL